MSTATKLEYLNETKSLLKDSINSLGGEITSQTTFRQYATELDSIYASLPKVSGSGSNISLSPTRKGRITSQINGDTFQQTYTGKNLIISLRRTQPTFIEYFYNNDYISKNMTFSIISDGNIENAAVFIKPSPGGSAYGIGTFTLVANQKANISFTLTDDQYNAIKESTERGIIQIYKNNGNLSSYQYSEIQLESGSSVSSFEPYTGGIASPNPDYPQEIKSVTGLQTINITGKNIYNPSFRRSNNTIYSTNCTATEENGLFTLVATDADMRMWNTINEGSNYGDTAGQLYELIYDDYSVSISNDLMVKNFITFYDENKVSLGFIQKRNNIFNFSKNDIANAKYFSIRIGYGQAVVGETYSFKVQLEQGSASEYEPYQTPQEYEINLGKNLIDTLATNTAITGSGLTYNRASDGSIQITGTSTRAWDYTLTTSYTFKAGETYTFSYDNLGTTNVNIYIPFNSANGGQLTLKPTDKTITRTITQDQTLAFTWSLGSGQTVDLNFKIMIVKGSEATSYSPYFTPIHLYEGDQIIGTPDNWSIKHVMGEVVLDGSENWANAGTGRFNSTNAITDYMKVNNIITYMSDKFQAFKQTGFNSIFDTLTENVKYGFNTNSSIGFDLRFKNADITSVADWKIWLSTHNTKVVYELAEPTTEPITNTELIEQLNAFYNAKSYNGQTNISVDGDLPMILDVSAIIGD